MKGRQSRNRYIMLKLSTDGWMRNIIMLSLILITMTVIIKNAYNAKAN